MSDLFQDGVSNYTIRRVMRIIEQCPQHTFQILTKRAERMADYFEYNPVTKNVWLGVTCENQETADERIPHLLSIDAPVRFLSCEPLLGSINLKPGVWIPPAGGGSKANLFKPWEEPLPSIDLVIVGGESGHNARPMHPDWARSIRDQCQSTGIPYFFKQWGEWGFEPYPNKSMIPSIVAR